MLTKNEAEAIVSGKMMTMDVHGLREEFENAFRSGEDNLAAQILLLMARKMMAKGEPEKIVTSAIALSTKLTLMREVMDQKGETRLLRDTPFGKGLLQNMLFAARLQKAIDATLKVFSEPEEQETGLPADTDTKGELEAERLTREALGRAKG